MMKLPHHKGLLTGLLLAFFTGVNAQHFHYQCLLDTVPQTGFYRIPVSPEMSVRMQTDFRDVRIWDAKEKQVPYIIRTRRPKWQSNLFTPFSIVENSLDDSGRSVMVVQKKAGRSIANLSFIIRNASVSRYASLSGSNDGKKWFIISEQLLINDSYETFTDSSIQSVSFPLSAYPFFRLVIDNSKNDPLNIVSIGNYASATSAVINPLTPNPLPQISQTDSSNGISYIKVVQQQPYRIDQIQFDIEGPKFFSRMATVLLPEKGNRKQPDYFNEIAGFSIASTTHFQAPLPVLKTGIFYLAIENGDNSPLTIKAVGTAQEYHEIVAWLQKGKLYKLLMDATDANVPQYDLQQFSDSIPATIPLLAARQITPVGNVTEVAKAEEFPRKWLWLIMAGVVALLGLLTWKLTTEMRKNT